MTAALVLYQCSHLSQSPLFLQLGGTRFKAGFLLCYLYQEQAANGLWRVKLQLRRLKLKIFVNAEIEVAPPEKEIVLVPLIHYSSTNMSIELLTTLLCAKTLLCFHSRASCGDLSEVKMLAVDGHTKDSVLQTTKSKCEQLHGKLCTSHLEDLLFHITDKYILRAWAIHSATGFFMLEQDRLSASCMLLWNATLHWYFYFHILMCQVYLWERMSESTWVLNKPCNVHYQLFVAEWQRICSQAVPFAFSEWILWMVQMKEHMEIPDIW